MPNSLLDALLPQGSQDWAGRLQYMQGMAGLDRQLDPYGVNAQRSQHAQGVMQAAGAAGNAMQANANRATVNRKNLIEADVAKTQAMAPYYQQLAANQGQLDLQNLLNEIALENLKQQRDQGAAQMGLQNRQLGMQRYMGSAGLQDQMNRGAQALPMMLMALAGMGQQAGNGIKSFNTNYGAGAQINP